MSLETWKQEFYPIPAETFNNGNYSQEEIFEHSIQKWTGLLSENIAKHGVHLDNSYFGSWMVVGDDYDDKTGNRVPITSESCSCCAAYYTSDSECDNCPLYEIGYGCSHSTESPYALATRCLDDDRILDMIDALKKAQMYGVE